MVLSACISHPFPGSHLGTFEPPVAPVFTHCSLEQRLVSGLQSRFPFRTGLGPWRPSYFRRAAFPWPTGRRAELC